MKAFLEYVAEDIIRKHGTNLSDVAVVFPNKRASLFMNRYLLKAAGRPLWSPHYITISELFRSQTDLTVADKIKSICMLYRTYKQYVTNDETLDQFWNWGEIMLSDFDDLDKNMGNAELVFHNVRDLHAFDSVSYLSEKDRETLKRFFAEFTDGHDSKLKQRFEHLWNQLLNIYRDFNAAMDSENLAYEGAMYRKVAETADTLQWRYGKYIFVGFNMIQKVEQTLFQSMKEKGLAYFYWDFDNYYLGSGNQEAGRFIEKWLVKYPNELDIKDGEIYDNFSKEKDITFLSAATENIQTRYISQWLKQNDRLKEGETTAIVLADESLLKSVIHCLPVETSGKMNITVGFPLSQSPVTALVENFLALHLHGYNVQQQVFVLKFVTALLRHPYMHLLSDKTAELQNSLHRERVFFPNKEHLCLDEGLSLLFTPIDCSRSEMNRVLVERLLTILDTIGKNSEKQRIDDLAAEGKDPDTASPTYEQQFLQESVFRMYNIMNRINDLVKCGDLTVDPATLLHLVDQIIRQTTMPFHGEPAVGIQVMGVLETRNLDFDHLLVISCNEGNLPKGINEVSFIPYSVRKAHELTTIDNKVAIYAYYFYRLIQRCPDISIAYNSSTEDGNTGQMSRFMTQLMAESNPSNTHIHHESMTARQSPVSLSVRSVDKDEQVLQVLNSMASLSPSAINSYMRCQLKFYYNNVAKIKEPDSDDISDHRTFGTIFHATAEQLYKNIQTPDGEITKEAIDALLKERNHTTVQRFVDEAFSEELFKGRKPHYDGLQLINREVICKYIVKMLDNDRNLAPFSIVGIEERAYERMTFNINGVDRELLVGGYIDRLDLIHDAGGDVLRVVDYKTGSRTPDGMAKKSVEEVFNKANIDKYHSDYYLQAMLYSTIVRHLDRPSESNDTKALNPHQLPVRPALMFIQKSKSVMDPVLKLDEDSIDDIAKYENEFRELLKKQVGEIFDKDVPFAATENERYCDSCPYARICQGAIPAQALKGGSGDATPIVAD